MSEEIINAGSEEAENELLIRCLVNETVKGLIMLRAVAPILGSAQLRRLLQSAADLSCRVKDISEAASEQLSINDAINGAPGGGA